MSGAHPRESNAPERPDPEPRHADRAERFRVPGSEILEHDTWAAEEACPNCGGPVSGDESRCASCGQWLERCSGSCPSCASPRCVGGKRERERR
jgi:hypothetical protein